MDWAAWWAEHWEFVLGIVIGGALGALINWIFYRKAEKPKRLAWEVMSANRIIHAEPNQRKRLKVVYEDQDVESPNIIVLRIGNGGKKEIVADDFPEPIWVDFGEAKIIGIDTSARSNEKVAGKIVLDPSNFGRFGFTPRLFNRDEWIEFQFVTDGPLVTPKLYARYAGQFFFMNEHPTRVPLLRGRTSLILGITAGVVALLGASLGIFLGMNGTKDLSILALTLLFAAAFTLGSMMSGVVFSLSYSWGPSIKRRGWSKPQGQAIAEGILDEPHKQLAEIR